MKNLSKKKRKTRATTATSANNVAVLRIISWALVIRIISTERPQPAPGGLILLGKQEVGRTLIRNSSKCRSSHKSWPTVSRSSWLRCKLSKTNSSSSAKRQANHSLNGTPGSRITSRVSFQNTMISSRAVSLKSSSEARPCWLNVPKQKGRRTTIQWFLHPKTNVKNDSRQV